MLFFAFGCKLSTVKPNLLYFSIGIGTTGYDTKHRFYISKDCNMSLYTDILIRKKKKKSLSG